MRKRLIANKTILSGKYIIGASVEAFLKCVYGLPAICDELIGISDKIEQPYPSNIYDKSAISDMVLNNKYMVSQNFHVSIPQNVQDTFNVDGGSSAFKLTSGVGKGDSGSNCLYNLASSCFFADADGNLSQEIPLTKHTGQGASISLSAKIVNAKSDIDGNTDKTLKWDNKTKVAFTPQYDVDTIVNAGAMCENLQKAINELIRTHDYVINKYSTNDKEKQWFHDLFVSRFVKSPKFASAICDTFYHLTDDGQGFYASYVGVKIEAVANRGGDAIECLQEMGEAFEDVVKAVIKKHS